MAGVHTRSILILGTLILAAGACATPANTARRTPASGATQDQLISIAGGRYESAAAYSELTYLIDTSKNLCFAISDRIQAGDLGGIGLTPVDCCVLRGSVPPSGQAWAASLRCEPPPAAPAAP